MKIGNKEKIDGVCLLQLSIDKSGEKQPTKRPLIKNTGWSIKHSASSTPIGSYTFYDHRKSLSYASISTPSLNFQFSSFSISIPSTHFLGTRWARYSMYYSWLGDTYEQFDWLVSELNGQLAGQTVSWIHTVTFYIVEDSIMYEGQVTTTLFHQYRALLFFRLCLSTFYSWNWPRFKIIIVKK